MDVKLDAKLSIHNRFDVEVIDAKTGKIKEKAVGYNVILNRLWNTAMNDLSKPWFGCIFYGSGSGTPSPSDSTLFNHVGAVWIMGGSSESDNDGTKGCTYTIDNVNCIISCRRSIQLNESTAVGVNLTEVGIGYGTSSTNLCTHAMLQDMNGNPISIQKTNTDIINIYATVYIHHNQPGRISLEANTSFRGLIFGTRMWFNNTNVNRHAALGVGSIDISKDSGPWKGNYTKYINTWSSGQYNEVTMAWDSATKKYTVKTRRMAIAEGNMGGIGSFWFMPVEECGWKRHLNIFVSDFYPGDDITGEAVGTGNGSTKRFAVKFDYPENAKVYVDGVLQTSGVTVRRIPRNTLGVLSIYTPWLNGSSTDEKNLVMGRDPWSRTYAAWSDSPSTKVAMDKNHIMRNDLRDIGFASLTANVNGVPVYGSNDLVNWTLIWTTQASQTVTLNDTTGRYKYYKTGTHSNEQISVVFTLNSEDWKAIVFDEAPANGAVITCDYHTPYIAKDTDHVFDFTYEIQFGEYTE